jgi:hypothetical protein
MPTPNELIESVRALAEAQTQADETERRGRIASKPAIQEAAILLMRQRERVCFIATEMDAPALLLHLERAAKVVEAAKELVRIVHSDSELNEYAPEEFDNLRATLKEHDNAK